MNSIITEGINFSLPLFIMALGGIYSEKSGIMNLSLEGLQGFGAFAGALSVILLGLSGVNPVILPFISFLFAVLGGVLLSTLHGVLCIKFNANQAISGVVINLLAMSVTAFLTSQINRIIIGKPSNKFILTVFPKISIPLISKIPLIGFIFSDFYAFHILIIVVSIFMYYLMYKTSFGLRLKACGENPSAVDACGGNVSNIRFIAVMISGGLSAIGGMSFAYYLSANFSSDIYFGAGFLAIAALIFGNWRISNTFLACVIFGFARSTGYFITRVMELPVLYSNLVLTLPYILTLLLLIFFSGSNRPPAAIGESYDKGKR